MTWGGWISMVASVTFVTTLFVWCCYRVVNASLTDADARAQDEKDRQ